MAPFQSAQHQPAPRHRRETGGFRAGQPLRPAETVRYSNQRMYGTAEDLSLTRDHRGCLDGLRVPAVNFQGGGDRWRVLLGRWLYGEPCFP